MNDPNGLVYDQGEYHLFYQYHPDDIVWGPMHWGHAVSRDLVRWEHLPIALYPDEIGTMFSGTAVVDADNTSGLVPGGGLVAVFSYDNQAQGVAYSQDRGRTWTKYAANPVLLPVKKDFRDPKIIWHAETQRWVMTLAALDTMMIYTSPNLIDWTFASDFTGGYRGGTWEVPDLFPMTLDNETVWVLILSVNPTGPAGGSATRYFIGTFDGTTFTDTYPDDTLWLDYGPDNYAGTTWNNVAGEPLFIGWMSNWLYADKLPTATWRGTMTVPRSLGLTHTPAGIRLTQRPVSALERLRQPAGNWADMQVEGAVALAGFNGRQAELVASFEMGSAPVFGIELFPGTRSSMRLAYETATQTLTITRPRGRFSVFPTRYSGPLAPINGQIQLQILIDQSSVEVFANDGQLAMTSQVFPDADADGIRLFAEGGAVTLRSLEAYTLESIWQTTQVNDR